MLALDSFDISEPNQKDSLEEKKGRRTGRPTGMTSLVSSYFS